MKNRVMIPLTFLLLFLFAYAWSMPQEGLYGTVSYLRWKAQEDQLQYASKLPTGIPASNANPFIFSINVVDQKFSFDSGFRITAGKVFCNDWDVRARFTQFKQRSRGSVNKNARVSDIGLVESAFGDTFINPIIFGTTAAACWNLNFFTADFDCGRFYDVGDCVTVESYIGFTVAHIKQHQKVNGGVVPINQDLSFTTVVANRCGSFSGAGPRIGCDIAWNFSPHWSLIGSASGALIIGTVKASTANILSDRVGISIPSCCTKNFIPFSFPFEPGWRFSLDDPTFTSKFCNKKTRVRPGVALSAGLEWDNDVCDCFNVFLSAAFEAQYWPDQWQNTVSPLLSQVGMLSGGDLTLYGATITGGIAF